MKIISLRFPTTDKVYAYPVEGKSFFKVGDKVLLSINQVIEPALVIKVSIAPGKNKLDKEEINSLGVELGEGYIMRKVTSEDEEKLIQLKTLARDYLPLCQEKIIKHKLGVMKLYDADFSFDGKKLTIYFGAEGRVDFRELVTDLVRSFKKLIRLQQIGARDEARLLGGFGPCGREICCQRFLKNMESITLDMAKEQNILASSSKISGLCGKLMCCLAYEKELYLELKKNLPPIGKEIKVGRSKGKVIEQNILAQTATVQLENGKIEKVTV